ncbi:PAS and ANTAR domain-containing protein [Nocardia fluminea]|uniref:PAS and ANTAR domain-containing protein n=1 Tax=Nocardia fluminea TaxID=134984 RepID=UPI0036549984
MTALESDAADQCERDHHQAHPALVGAFTFWFATQRWEWSAEVYRMHGYTPGQVEPTTDLLLAHKHPADRDIVADLIARTLAEGEPFSSRHRFLDTTGQVHTVMVIADRVLDDHGEPVGTTGYYLDLTETVDAATNAAVTEVVSELVQSRAVIEQAKSVLMCMYGIAAEQAFKVLVWRSQETNVKLRDIAAAVLASLTMVPAPPAGTITAFDHLLLTCHERTDQQ